MPILRKKSSKKVNVENGNDNLIGDITINDFANSSRIHTRFKKAIINVSSEVRQKITIDEESFLNEMNENYQNNLYDSNKSKKSTKGVLTNQRNKKTNYFKKDIEEQEGIDYPLDIWFIISEYISPEAIGKFAQICRSSYYVVSTGKFWFHLYKSYYKFVPGLPERLQPQCMVRTHGLRACVIRTLHYTYFALKRKVDDVSYLRQDEPHSLIKRQCCLMWHKEGKMRWYFYFKLKELSKTTNNLLKQKKNTNGKKTDFIEMLEDVAVNIEEGCKILRVTCLKYSMLPPVIGLILQSVSMTLMPGFKDHRLQLGFGTSDIPNTLTNQVILNEVVNYQILDWWHPTYPHQDSIISIELPQSDSWDQNLL
ncbi:transmembrane protein [Apis mellifera caucasica]|uniref:Transmembrane protein 183B isoform X1 n=1 Tax=Apis mellifera TaxID=7460 RepID=A0A7M7MRI5_APIME|nr:transmembrane protein 183B isoform X1 [Apis mellifera]XP_392998.5 transmembrane protein 183B isoform X1 [Apis mellifera]KAG6799863.1 transmembrane protein [Apis mellifera caucasica]KAG9435783.1 transmembrane protein [Apis mellifera carnica]|eukprot:XP_026299863.1 transmembrane protein 183B isoform X1 [Apis mellifera]